MSGETEGQPFGWTHDSLKLHLVTRIAYEADARIAGDAAIERVLDERDRRYEQRWVSQEDAVRLALVGVNKEMIERMRQVREETQAAMLASDKAISKAEDATERRFAAVNGFQAAISDQNASFARRREVDAIANGLTEKVEAGTAASTARYEAAVTRLATLAEDIVALKVATARVAALEETLRAQKERLDKTEGHGQGSAALWGYIVGAVGLILTIVTLANVVTTR